MRPTPSTLLLLIAALTVLSCAGQMSPPGGPVDTVPPGILRTFPDTNAVRVSTQQIILEFTEYVDRRSVEESIFISPPLGILEFDWSGTELTIDFPDTLRKNTTYVVNVGTDIVDVRARNRMASGFTLAFSTGDSIDQGWISGRVYDEKPVGVMLFAYVLDDIRPDTLDPTRTKPDFVVQTGGGGDYRLSNIPLKSYRLFAVRDEYRNFLYDRGIDQIGVASGDVALGPVRPGLGGINFLLTQEDTTRIALASASAIHRTLVEVRLSEPPDSILFESAVFTLRDTLTGELIPLAGTYLKPGASNVVGVLTAVPLDSGRICMISARGLVDRAGNGLDSSRVSSLVAGSGLPDTMAVRLNVTGLADSARAVPVERPLELQFSEAVYRGPVVRGITLADTAGRRVVTDLQWIGGARLRITPATRLESRRWYHLTLPLDSVKGLRGAALHDTTFTFRFETLDLRTTGVLDGALADDRSGPHGYEVVVRPTGQSPAQDRTVKLASPGRFTVENLVEGNYALFAYETRDTTGGYRYGSAFPYRTAARFTVYGDTVKVRARWAVEGVLLRLAE